MKKSNNSLFTSPEKNKEENANNEMPKEIKSADKKNEIFFLDDFFWKKINEDLNKKALTFNTEYINETYSKILKQKKFDQKEVTFIKGHLKHKHNIIVNFSLRKLIHIILYFFLNFNKILRKENIPLLF
jgi:hypothetical protein